MDQLDNLDSSFTSLPGATEPSVEAAPAAPIVEVQKTKSSKK